MRVTPQNSAPAHHPSAPSHRQPAKNTRPGNATISLAAKYSSLHAITYQTRVRRAPFSQLAGSNNEILIRTVYIPAAIRPLNRSCAAVPRSTGPQISRRSRVKHNFRDKIAGRVHVQSWRAWSISSPICRTPPGPLCFSHAITGKSRSQPVRKIQAHEQMRRFSRIGVSISWNR